MTDQKRKTSLFSLERGKREGISVVFIHGFPFSHEMWEVQLEAVSRSYHAVAYDVRGHGRSEVGDGQYMIEGHVEDLKELLDQLSLPRCVVVGLSMGGYIALRAREKYPDRFSGIVLCDTRSEADPNEGKLKRYAGAVAVKQHGSAPFAEGFLPGLFAPENLRRCQKEVDLVRKMISATPPLSIAGTLIALAARTDTTASLSSIGIPTLIMVGEFDALTPPAASQAMHERIPGSALHVVPGAGHMSNLENPEFFNETLLQFLKTLSSGSAGQKRV